MVVDTFLEFHKLLCQKARPFYTCSNLTQNILGYILKDANFRSICSLRIFFLEFVKNYFHCKEGNVIKAFDSNISRVIQMIFFRLPEIENSSLSSRIKNFSFFFICWENHNFKFWNLKPWGLISQEGQKRPKGNKCERVEVNSSTW